MRSNGKSTEKDTEDRLYQLYGTRVMVDRLPDKFDTGQYQDIRPSDFIASFAKGEELRVVYIECKDTKAPKMTLAFSRFRKGQLQAMHRCVGLKIPYFVVFRSLMTGVSYLIPATKIIAAINLGKKSLSEEVVLTFPWRAGEKLYDYTGSV